MKAIPRRAASAAGVPSGIAGKWAVVVSAHDLGLDGRRIDGAIRLPHWAQWDDGWNGSFHDCQFWGAARLVVWGRSPGRALKRAKKAVALIAASRTVDAITAKHRLRRLVRPGD
jgi:hypothetical protein